MRFRRAGGTLNPTMRFSEGLWSGGFPVAIEITPPHANRRRVLLRRASMLGEAACAVNVIQRPERMSSLDASIELIAEGLDPVWHLVTRGRTHDEIAVDLARAAAAGVACVLCIRGDHALADRDDTPTVRESVAMAVKQMPGALVGATANQYGDRGAVLKNLFPKLAAGARYVQTQPVFAFEQLRPLAEAVKERSPETAIVAMAMPLTTQDAVERIPARLGVSLPEGLAEDFAANGEESGWARFADAWAELVASPLVDGVAVMTFEMDASPLFAERLRGVIARAGVV